MIEELRLEPVHSLEAARAEWVELAAQAENVFASWEWSSIWWRHFGVGRQQLVTLCRAGDGSAVALLPLYLWLRQPLRVVRFIGHGPADQLGPLCRKEQRTLTAAALRRALDAAGCQVFLGDTLHGDERWSKLLQARVYGREPSPILPLEWSSWDEFLASRSANFRSQLRRRERALGKLGSRFRLCDDQRRLHKDLDAFFALHRSRWRDEQSNVARLESFHREFAASAFDCGWLRLWFLEVEGEPVAAWYGLRSGGIDWYYQAGRNPAWDRYAPGFVLLCHSVRNAIADGMREYRFGRGGEHYKARFGPDDPGLETILLTRGAAGRSVVVGVEAARRTKRTLRRLTGQLLAQREALG